PRESAPPANPIELAAPVASLPEKRGCRFGGLLVAAIFGLLCLWQIFGPPIAGRARSSSKMAAVAAKEMQLPSEVAGWQLARPQHGQTQPAEVGLQARFDGELAAHWCYRRGNLVFTLVVWDYDPLWHDPAAPWVDRGWHAYWSGHPDGEPVPGLPAIYYREYLFSKPELPGYACDWSSPVPSACRLNIEGWLFSHSVLSPDERAAGRELYCRLVAALDRGISSRMERRP
ncbi:MAG TPA: hypothetical protein VHY20_06315, partial [Pirellulales bacterium]|nr:hypothetical protein [Pirellulales bacterium]